MLLAWIGAAEVLGGMGLLMLGPDWKGAGHFLAGIGGVVLLASLIWTRNAPASGLLPRLAWIAFWLVQLQGLLGGLRVVLDKALVGNVTLGLVFGMIHGCLGQVFFVLLGSIAVLSAPAWGRLKASMGAQARPLVPWLVAGTAAVFLQLVLGAAMRHQHAGLAIPDFPTAYGQWWPATDSESLLGYNQRRTHESVVTAFQIHLQMIHRLGAVLCFSLIWAAAIQTVRRLGRGALLSRWTMVWAGVVLMQFGLGMLTIWTNKAADVATAHVAGGALLLLNGTVLILIARKLTVPSRSVAPVTPVGIIAPTAAS
jgi:cytochrome c oxidase assembly protein subunit 15